MPPRPITKSGRYLAYTRLLGRTPDAESCDAGTIIRYRSKALAKEARVPFAAYVSVGLVALVATAAFATASTELGCLPDPDRPTSDAGTDTGSTIAARACGDGFIDPTLEAGAEECDPGLRGGPGCTPSCKVECNGGMIDPVTKHCYFRVGRNDSEQGASTACGQTQGHVITFVSDNEVGFIADAGLANVGNMPSQFWVGLSFVSKYLGYQSDSYGNGEPGWNYPDLSAACPGCYARTGSDASTYFPPLGPGSDAGPECVYADSLTEWHHSPCSNAPKHDTLCEREPPGSRATVCNGGICITVAQTNKRYLFVPSDTTADDAKTSCQLLNGSLVILETREEREQLAHEIAQYTGKEGATFWVGLAANAAGNLVWDDSSAAGRPSTLGIDAGAATPNARVFISLGTSDPIDRGLGHLDDATSLHPYVCQY